MTETERAMIMRFIEGTPLSEVAAAYKVEIESVETIIRQTFYYYALRRGLGKSIERSI